MRVADGGGGFREMLGLNKGHTGEEEVRSGAWGQARPGVGPGEPAGSTLTPVGYSHALCQDEVKGCSPVLHRGSGSGKFLSPCPSPILPVTCLT